MPEIEPKIILKVVSHIEAWDYSEPCQTSKII